jgi:hypothetical protein
MKPQLLTQLGSSIDERSFLNQLGILLAPYGVVARSQVMVDWIEPNPELCCFVAMETPRQAAVASNGLGLVLLGDNCLFVSVHLTKSFTDFNFRSCPTPSGKSAHGRTISSGLDSWGSDATA